MCWCRCTAASTAAFLSLFGLSPAQADMQARPPFTFCEQEDNDTWERSQVLDASIAAALGDEQPDGSFFLTGKLQMDRIWNIEPKCALRAYAKPQPARDATGQVIAGQFYEPVIVGSNDGVLENLVPFEDGTVRLGVAALPDAFDGVVNGLALNGPHHETGEVTLELYYNRGASSPAPGSTSPDATYVFQFQNGADALRVSFVIPDDVVSVTVQCRNQTGTVGVCYDTDFYRITHLEPGALYCITVVGGLDPECRKTDTLLAWFDKQGYQIGGANGLDDDGGDGVYSRLCVYADADGSIWFAVSGHGDSNCNGLADALENDYFDFLQTLRIRHGFYAAYRQGASTDDGSAGDVIRYPRGFVDAFGQTVNLWEDSRYANWFAPGRPPESRVQHGVCGGYCIRISRTSHAAGSGGDNPVVGAARADINADGVVNASDLALLLSYWGATN